MKKMLKTLFTCVVGATTLMLLNPSQAEALKYESAINGYEVIIEGTDTTGDGIVTRAEMDQFYIKKDGLEFNMLESALDFQFDEKQKLKIVSDPSFRFRVIRSDERTGLLFFNPFAFGDWNHGFVEWGELEFSAWDSRLMERTLPAAAVATTNPPPALTSPALTSYNASTPEPSLSLLGFITLGGFMLGSRKKEKA